MLTHRWEEHQHGHYYTSRQPPRGAQCSDRMAEAAAGLAVVRESSHSGEPNRVNNRSANEIYEELYLKGKN